MACYSHVHVCECFMDGVAAALRLIVPPQVKESNEVPYSRLKVRTVEALLLNLTTSRIARSNNFIILGFSSSCDGSHFLQIRRCGHALHLLIYAPLL